MPSYPNFVSPSYQSQSPIVDDQRIVNLMVTIFQSPGARVSKAYFPTPGVANVAVLPKAPTRGGFSYGGRTFAVGGTQTYEITGAFGVNAIGGIALATDANPVTWATSGDAGAQLLFSSGGKAYWMDLNTNVITDTGLAGSIAMVDYLDTFGLALDVSSSTLRVSKSLDFSTWPGTSIYQRVTAADRYKALKVLKNKAFLFGDFTTDVLYNAGNAVQPLAPVQGSGATIRHGIAAVHSVKEFRGTLIWLAQNSRGGRYILRATGIAEPEKISTDALDFQLRRYSSVSDAEAFVDIQDGDEVYVLNCPKANVSWAFTEQGGWHERGPWNHNKGQYDVWFPRWQTFNFGRSLVGDRTTGAIYQLSPNFSNDPNGGPLRRLCRPPALVAQDGAKVTISNLELVLDCDPRLDQGVGSDPTVMAHFSKDGGRTWGAERWRTAGKKGNFSRRVRWSLLGSSRIFTPEFVLTDPVPLRILDCLINEDERAA